MYHQIVLVGNKSYSQYFEYKHGVLIEFDITTLDSLILQGDQFQIRKATDEEFEEVVLKGK